MTDQVSAGVPARQPSVSEGVSPSHSAGETPADSRRLTAALLCSEHV